LVMSVPLGFIPFYSPDGRRLLVTGGNQERGEVRVAGASGDDARTLLNGTLPGGAAPTFSRWSKDGRRIYLLAIDAAGRTSIWSMSVDGGTPTLLVRFDDPARESNRREFDADGQHIYFTLARKEGDVGVMDIR